MDIKLTTLFPKKNDAWYCSMVMVLSDAYTYLTQFCMRRTHCFRSEMDIVVYSGMPHGPLKTPELPRDASRRCGLSPKADHFYPSPLSRPSGWYIRKSWDTGECYPEARSKDWRVCNQLVRPTRLPTIVYRGNMQSRRCCSPFLPSRRKAIYSKWMVSRHRIRQVFSANWLQKPAFSQDLVQISFLHLQSEAE